MSALVVSLVMSIAKTRKRSSEPSSSGFAAILGLLRDSASLNCSRSTISMPFGFRSSMLTLSAAGFIATSTSQASPGVKTSLDEKFSWKPADAGERSGRRADLGGEVRAAC